MDIKAIKDRHTDKTKKKSGNRILLVRHGETEWNRLHRFQGRSDIPLNPKGNHQARALGLALKKETITAIYSSPLERAVETASHIAQFHPSVPLMKESGLIEMDLGDFEGQEAHQWKKKHPAFDPGKKPFLFGSCREEEPPLKSSRGQLLRCVLSESCAQGGTLVDLLPQFRYHILIVFCIPNAAGPLSKVAAGYSSPEYPLSG